MRTTLSIFLAFFLVGCATTSGIKQEGSESIPLNFSNYDVVVVNDFGDATKKGDLPTYAGSSFADRIDSAIRSKGVFKEVSRNADDVDSNALVIGGNITRYAEGNAALKMMIGLGAGSTYFDAKVTFTDSVTKQQLGEVTVDKNSWALGGGLAAGQSVEHFMNQAAQKIADELADAKVVIPAQ